jgi:formylglycine-generating enzyme required for sulfatase activity
VDHGVVTVTVAANRQYQERTVYVDIGGAWHQVTQQAAGIWSEAVPLTGNWLQLDWLGNFIDHGNWMYHAAQGWWFYNGKRSDSFYFYDTGLDAWAWSSDKIYPWVFLVEPVDRWVRHHQLRSTLPRWLYDPYQQDWRDGNAWVEGIRTGFTLIPAGTFMMGSPPDETGRRDDETVRAVTLTRAILMAQREVTFRLWRRARSLASRVGYSNITEGRKGNLIDVAFPDDVPITGVSWWDAVIWCNMLSELEGLVPVYYTTPAFDRVMRSGTGVIYANLDANGYRLPTEAEWEYAARAGTTSAYYTGPLTQPDTGQRDPSLDLAGWYLENSGGLTHSVRWKRANNWVLYDMLGNVEEWCWDRYGPYEPGDQVDPAGPASGTSRVSRGGHWNSQAADCRAAARNSSIPATRTANRGFRLVRTAPPP